MSTGIYARLGDVDLPIVAPTNGQLYSVLDPGRDALLGFYKDAINFELAGVTSGAPSATSAWGIAAAGTKLAAVLPVADTLYRAPSKGILREAKITFPVLCLCRTTAEHDEFTLALERITQDWRLDYILGPLDVAAARRLGGALHGAITVVNLVTRLRAHAAHLSGALMFGEGYGHFNTVQIVSSEEGVADWGEQGEGVEFLAASMVLRTTEIDQLREDDVPGAPMGTNVSIRSAGLDIKAYTDVPVQAPFTLTGAS